MWYRVQFLHIIGVLLPSIFHAPAIADVFSTPIPADNTRSPVIVAALDSEQTENLPTAVIWYLEMAENGDKDAQYNLGSIYETGFGVEINTKEAAQWYRKAALQDHELAQLRLGMLFYVGEGVKQSTIKGVKWIRESADLGNTLAQLLNEKVLAPDADPGIDAIKLVSKVRNAFEKGQINAEETLRLELQKIRRARRVAEMTPKPRFSGDVTGSGAKPGTVKNRVPEFLQGAPKRSEIDDSLVAIRFRAKDGDADAQYKLGRMYEQGTTEVDRNKSEAFRWYNAAAAQGHRDAQYRLGLAYLFGEGTLQNSATAAMWFKRAKANKQPAATVLLSHIATEGTGKIEGTQSLLLTWLLERSLDGDGEAMLGLGNMFEKGWGVPQDVEVAEKWYAKARAAGAKGAARRLRIMKADGVDDIAEAEPINEPRRIIRDDSAKQNQISSNSPSVL
jgi:TPR repeat protein